MNVYDYDKPPSPAYTKKDAMRLMREYEGSRPRTFAIVPQWKPDVAWRLIGGGLFKPDPTDSKYIDGRWQFAWPGNSKKDRRTLARRDRNQTIYSITQVPYTIRNTMAPYYKSRGDGRRKAVRIPVMDWRWWEPMVDMSKKLEDRPVSHLRNGIKASERLSILALGTAGRKG